MAKLRMKRIEILALLEHSKDIIDLLQIKGTVELSERVECDAFEGLPTHPSVSFFEKYLNEAKSAYEVLSQYDDSKGSLLSALEGKRELTISEYIKKTENVDWILSRCAKVNALHKSIQEDKAALAQLESQTDLLLPWINLDISPLFKPNGQSRIFVGSLPLLYTEEELNEAIIGQIAEESFFDLHIISTIKEKTNIALITHSSVADDVLGALKALGFAKISDSIKGIPAEELAKVENDMSGLEKKIDEDTKELKSFTDCLEGIKFVIDYFTLRINKYENMEKLSVSNNALVISGFIPEKKSERLAKELEEKFSAIVSLNEPDEDDDVPVLLENRPFAAGVEGITEMYSLPGKEDYDPNPVMAFFYYALFGIMLSDAGYGLLMVISMLFVKFKYKLESNTKKTVDMFLYCGVSTLFWGAMFGSWFGDIVQVVGREFFGKDIPSLALWFEPVNDPMKMLLYSFLFGIMHLFLGLGIRFYTLWKNNQKLDAVLDVIPVYLLVTGVAPIGAGVVLDVPETISSIGKKLALAGAVLIILTSGRSAKNIIGKLGGGLYELYNTGAGYMGDILSYSRLLALGLSTGVVASVINLLGTMPSNKILKAIMLIFVFIFGQGVNLAINLIGAYVHTNRLFFVEFFSKFYEGGGRAFTPLKMNTSYFKIKEEK